MKKELTIDNVHFRIILNNIRLIRKYDELQKETFQWIKSMRVR